MLKMLIHDFITYFKESIQGAELKATGQAIRAFLEEQEETITLQSFNRLTGCLGRTTGNKYIYSVPYLLSLIEEEQKQLRREFSTGKIKTLEVYGSKRRWRQEWEVLLKYANNQGCNCLLDLFAGSGFIALLASKLNIYDKIILNEASSLIYNFHSVMKSEHHFQEFILELENIKSMNLELFNSLKQSLYNNLTYVGKEKRKYSQSISTKKAIELFTVKHYAYNAQGSYVTRRKPLFYYINSLKYTHKLYECVELQNFYYKKLLLEHIKDDNFLIVIDPPYLAELREQQKSYELEFTERQHLTLIQLLSKTECKAKIVLCGYEGNYNKGLYSRYLKRSSQKWHCIRLLKNGRLDKSDEVGKEHIWLNFEANYFLQFKNLFEIIY